MKNSYLVTGGTGSFGSAFVEKLLTSKIFKYRNSLEFPSYLQRILFKNETIQKFQNYEHYYDNHRLTLQKQHHHLNSCPH